MIAEVNRDYLSKVKMKMVVENRSYILNAFPFSYWNLPSFAQLTSADKSLEGRDKSQGNFLLFFVHLFCNLVTCIGPHLQVID